jgi:ElaB/YqjD/DUF883 family membrane-anchored ribosome-binding protein
MKDIKKSAESLSKGIDETGERLQDTLNKARENGSHAWEKFQDRRKAVVNDTRGLIRKHPGKAVGLALLGGTVIGALVSLRRNKA